MLRSMLLREKCSDFHHSGLAARSAVRLMNNIEVSSLVLAQEPAVTIRALIKFNLRHASDNVLSDHLEHHKRALILGSSSVSATTGRESEQTQRLRRWFR